MGNYWRRPLGSKLILLLVPLFLIEMAFPWQRPCQATPSGRDTLCGWVSGYEGSAFALYAAAFAAAILVWELAPVLVPRLSMRGWPTGVVTAILAVGLALATLVKVIDDNNSQTRWAWLGLALALTIMLTALIRVRYRWGIRGRDRLTEPPPDPQPPHVSDAP